MVKCGIIYVVRMRQDRMCYNKYLLTRMNINILLQREKVNYTTNVEMWF